MLSEGRTADKSFTDVVAERKRSYTAPLMSALKAARAAGTARDDLPLRLMRDMVYGAMEHLLWDCVEFGAKPDIALTSRQLTDMLGAAFAPRTASEQALRGLHADVSTALQRFNDKARWHHTSDDD